MKQLSSKMENIMLLLMQYLIILRGHFECGNVGIDMGMKTFSTLSDGTKIANLDLTYEEEDD